MTTPTGHRLPLLEDDGWSRRHVLQLLGMGALAACQPPREPILPYTVQPAGVVPGKPQFYATTMTLDGYATGLLVESHVGRPTKIEGNPDHPASLGATGLQHQASILDLYDPSRARLPRRREGPAGWETFVREFGPLLPGAGVPPPGEGLHFVLPPTTSPLAASLVDAVRTRYPRAAFHFHAPLYARAADEAARAAFGQVLATQRFFDRATRVLAIDADFLGTSPFGVRWSHDFAQRRRVHGPADDMNRLYVVESDLGLAGAIADHRLRARPSEVPLVFLAIARALVRGSPRAPDALRGALERLPADLPHAPWAEAAARDLLQHAGDCVVIVGDTQPAEVHVLAHALNDLLGNVGRTVAYTPTAIVEAGEASFGLEPLLAAMDARAVSTLVLLDVDPVRDAFADDRFGARMAQVPQTVCLSLRETATAKASRWFLPGTHWLESWGDARAFDGTLSLRQPLVRPLYGGHDALEVLAVFAGLADTNPWRLLRTLHQRTGAAPTDATWNAAVQRGLFPGTAFAEVAAAFRADAVAPAVNAMATRARPGGIEIALRPDPRLHDGTFAHNEWLLELPDPITRVSWDNPAHVSHATARRLDLHEGDVVEVRWNDRSLRIPVLPTEGVADDTLALTLGWGAWVARERDVVGTDAYPLRTRAAPWDLAGATVEPIERPRPVGGTERVRVELASGQPHIDMHDRPILLHDTLETFRNQPDFVRPHDDRRPSLYGAWTQHGPQWGMSIDLGTCTGCATCVIACQAENNIPTVGRIGTAKGRAMHWLRIDRYRLGTGEDDVQLLPQPMLCQHCEKAPCEYVCPVNATVHSPDGLNEMVYNRCIGTRFCSNNCPYKVRRFNFLEYNDYEAETPKMQKNPDVTVRARGVMEKCTYCVQRIRTAQIEARIERRELRDGEVRTACQAACPTGAIVFGQVSDPNSGVAALQGLPHSYAVLQHELGTEPRTRYLAHLRNENEEVPA